jgi:hypothetical protein
MFFENQRGCSYFTNFGPCNAPEVEDIRDVIEILYMFGDVFANTIVSQNNLGQTKD